MREQWRTWMAEEDRALRRGPRRIGRADVVVDGRRTRRVGHDREQSFVATRWPAAMSRRSAGILLYRRAADGGSRSCLDIRADRTSRRRMSGAWGIPKGEIGAGRDRVGGRSPRVRGGDRVPGAGWLRRSRSARSSRRAARTSSPGRVEGDLDPADAREQHDRHRVAAAVRPTGSRSPSSTASPGTRRTTRAARSANARSRSSIGCWLPSTPTEPGPLVIASATGRHQSRGARCASRDWRSVMARKRSGLHVDPGGGHARRRRLRAQRRWRQAAGSARRSCPVLRLRGYRYDTVAPDGMPGFEAVDFDDSGFSRRDGHVRHVATVARWTRSLVTPWEAGDDLLVRRVFDAARRRPGATDRPHPPSCRPRSS